MILSKKLNKKTEHEVMYLVLKDLSFKKKKNPVMMAWWTHLYPSRTQKLSTTAAMIA